MKNQTSLYHLIHQPMSLIGFILLVFFVFITLFGSYLVPNDPFEVDMAKRLLSPSFEYPFGTDHLGRCIFSRIVEGSQSTLGITAFTIMTVVLIGVPIGLISGYVGGRLDSIMMRILDALSSIPEFILAIAIAGFLGPSLINIMLAVVLINWMSYARVVRGIVLSEREKEYVLAARVGGCDTWKLLRRHLLPQVLRPVITLAVMDIGTIILTISSLSFLGLGAQPPEPEWGAMLNDARPYFQTSPELMLYPGMAIILIVTAANLIGDGLSEKFRVR
ncbi:nickel transporter permease [Risungbinella massiliensis]|uniref:nickel transporter permease n=1 Tax=Risungbinella massiliensis TaxID=1329796 RepID=UPI0005CC4F17|nr:nickel transporter permease [Risungbinella massiliensis]